MYVFLLFTTVSSVLLVKRIYDANYLQQDPEVAAGNYNNTS